MVKRGRTNSRNRTIGTELSMCTKVDIPWPISFVSRPATTRCVFLFRASSIGLDFNPLEAFQFSIQSKSVLGY